jgi:hypothetical protein
MRRNCLVPSASAIACALAGTVLAGVLFAGAPARADIGVRINIGNAPPAPHMVFRVRPHERFYPGEGVYIVDDPGVGDYDCFRYGGYYWVFRGGYWYRAPSWRGRFVVVHPRYVPARFYRMPPARWKHHPSGPPGHMNQGGGPPAHVDQGRGGSPGHMVQGGNKGRRGPAVAPAKKDAKDHGKQGDSGRR